MPILHCKNELKMFKIQNLSFGKSAHFQVPENGTSSARIQKLRPLFHANIPPKWWSRCLFYSFTTFGRVIGKFWILNILTLFLEWKKGIFYKMAASISKVSTISLRDTETRTHRTYPGTPESGKKRSFRIWFYMHPWKVNTAKCT